MYQKLIRGNICDVLMIDDEPDDMESFNSILECSFKKGIIYVLAYLESEMSMEDIFNFSTEEILIPDIKQIFKGSPHFESIKASFFITKAMVLYKKYSEEFYNQKMLDKIASFKLTVLVMGTFLGLMLLVFARFFNRYLNHLFKDLMASLFLIPYNSLLKDDKLREMIKHLDVN